MQLNQLPGHSDHRILPFNGNPNASDAMGELVVVSVAPPPSNMNSGGTMNSNNNNSNSGVNDSNNTAAGGGNGTFAMAGVVSNEPIMATATYATGMTKQAPVGGW